MVFFFFKQKTAYEMRIRDWSSDVCSSDLLMAAVLDRRLARLVGGGEANRAAAASAAEIVAIIRDSADQHPFTAADATAVMDALHARSEERRVGKERVSMCSYRGSPFHAKKHDTPNTVTDLLH